MISLGVERTQGQVSEDSLQKHSDSTPNKSALNCNNNSNTAAASQIRFCMTFRNQPKQVKILKIYREMTIYSFTTEHFPARGLVLWLFMKCHSHGSE